MNYMNQIFKKSDGDYMKTLFKKLLIRKALKNNFDDPQMINGARRKGKQQEQKALNPNI